jgi:hypothetical protein
MTVAVSTVNVSAGIIATCTGTGMMLCMAARGAGSGVAIGGAGAVAHAASMSDVRMARRFISSTCAGERQASVP